MPDEILETSSQDHTDGEAESAETTDTTQETEAVEQSTPDAQEKAEEKAAESPEIGDFSLPEGVDKEDPTIAALKDLATAEGMTQKQAQAALDMYYGKVLPAQKEAISATVKAWEADSLKAHGKQGIEEANSALARFGSPEYIDFLKESGLGNHPQEIAMWRKVHSQIAESKLVEGSAAVSKPANYADVMFPTTKK